MDPSLPQPDPAPADGSSAARAAGHAVPPSVLSLLERSCEAFLALDRQWRYLYVNPQAERLLRRARSELIGRSLWDVFPGAEAAPAGSELRRAAAGTTAVEFRAQWPPLDAWFDVRALPSDEGLAVYFHEVTAREGTPQVEVRRAPKEDWEHVRLVTDSVPALIGYVDRDLRYRFANSAYTEWFGIDPEQVVGRTIPELLGPDVFSQRQPFVERVLRGERVRFEGPTPHRALGVRDTHVSYVPDPRAGGEVRGFYVLVHDVTDLKQAQVALQNGQELLRLAQRAASAGVWDYDLLSGAVRWSDECHRVYGTDPATFVPTADAWAALLHDEDRALVQDRMRVAMEERREFDLQFRVVHGQKGVRWLWEVGRAEYDAEGRPVRLAGIALDVTERRTAEEALRQSEERLARAQRIAGLGDWELDCATNEVYWSPEMYRLFRVPADRFKPTVEWFMSMVPEEDRPRLWKAFEDALAARASYNIDHRLVLDDGTVRHVAEQAEVLREATGKPVRVVGTMLDITERVLAEEALRDNERRLGLALSASGMGIWELDVRTGAIYWSPETFEVTGLPPADSVRAEDFFALVLPEDRARVKANVEGVLRDGSRFEWDYRVRRPDGRVRWLSDHGRVLRGAGGEPLKLVGTVQDVTRRKEEAAALRDSEHTLRESRERLRAALAAAEMGTWRLDFGSGVATRDAGTSRMLGLGEEDTTEPASTFHARVHPDDLPAVEAAVRRAVADRGTYLAEFRVVRSDGSIRWIREQGKVICTDDPSGVPVPASMTGASVDITERKRAEHAVREANQRMSAVIDASPLAVMAVDKQGTVILWNPTAERVFGWTAQEAVGRFLPIVPEYDIPNMREMLRLSLAGQPVAGVEVRRLRKDGSLFDAALWTSRLDGDDGAPFAVLGILTDITERKYAEAALEQARRDAEAANRAKDQFLAVLSHELRTPLTPVVMTLAGLELDRTLSQDVRDDLAMIRRNVELETRLIDDLLDVTRITHGKLRLHPQPTNAHALTESVLEILRSEIRGKRLELRCELGAADAVVSGDAARLQQVIWNLVKNALKFTPEGGHITVRTSNPTPRTLVIEVNDDGIGIDPAAIPRLFNAFEQAEQSVTRQFGGLGLGLAISKALVELHGGRIRAESRGKHTGATFTVELPTVGAISKLVSQIQPPGAAGQGAAGRRPVRVLLVEDHPDTLRTMKRLLEKMGYEVVAAASAGAALSALAREAVDVLVSDIGLPDATGHELMRQVRLTHDVPGIAVSGFGMDADVKNSRDAGFATHITKPVDLKQLDAAIRSAVRAAAGR